MRLPLVKTSDKVKLMKRLLQLFTVAIVAAGTMFAQAAATAPAKGGSSAHSKAGTKKGSASNADTKKGASASAEKSVGVVDINTASAEELKQIPGIGDAYSAKIIANRPYRSKNELVDKKVLPAGVYAKVKDHLIAKGGAAAAPSSSTKAGSKK